MHEFEIFKHKQSVDRIPIEVRFFLGPRQTLYLTWAEPTDSLGRL